MFRKKPLTAIAARLRQRFHERIEHNRQVTEEDEKPSLSKWLMFMLLMVLIGFLLYYIMGPQNGFQFPVVPTE